MDHRDYEIKGKTKDLLVLLKFSKMLHLKRTDLDCTWCSSNSGVGRIFNNCVVLRACIGEYVMDFGCLCIIDEVEKKEIKKN